MEEIRITRRAKGTFDVASGERKATELMWEEMWGLVAQMTMPEGRPCLGWLRMDAQFKAKEPTETHPTLAFELSDRILAALRERHPGEPEMSVVVVPDWVHVRVGSLRFTTPWFEGVAAEDAISRVLKYFDRPVAPAGSEFEGLTSTGGTGDAIRWRGPQRWRRNREDHGAGDDYPVTGV